MSGIEWHEWGNEAFEKALKLDRPVLLSLSATWCHWCHVMDSTSYSSKEVIDLVNSQFVPIRVDVDKRPDISDRYNFGGFPTTAFLTPERIVITGGTYIPPEMLKALLADVTVLYKRDKEKLLVKEKTTPVKAKKIEAADLSFQLSEAETIIFEFFDPVNGGFGMEPKFPQPKIIDLALFYYHLKPDKDVLAVITRTLNRMRNSKLYDSEEGGFFRYSITGDWSTPHYEKMLETNALLLKNYVEAYHAIEDMRYFDTAKGIIRYIDKNLSNQESGGFYGSQDADEQYYQLRMDERQKKQAPRVDRTLYVNWNGLATSAYLQAYSIMDLESCREFALKTIDFLLKNCSSEKGMYHYYDGASKIEGLLRDQVYLAGAIIDAYQVTGQIRYLESARKIADTMLGEYYDREAGGFFDIAAKKEGKVTLERHKAPVENFAAADLLARLYHLTADEEYRKQATSTLLLFSDLYPEMGFQSADFALASLKLQQSPVLIRVVGSRSDERTIKMLKEALRIYEPRKIVQLFDPDEDSEKLPHLKFPAREEPVVYLCIEDICLPPIVEIKQMRQKIEDFKFPAEKI